MTQYFYDFKSGRPGANPSSYPAAGLSRLVALNDSLFHQNFSKTSDGVDVWMKNPDGVAATNNFSHGYMWGPTGVQAADVDCLAKLVVSQYNGGSFSNDGPGFFARVSGQPADYQYYYSLQAAGVITSTSSFMRKNVASVSTDLGVLTAGAGIDKSAPVWFRFQVTGTTLRMKSWLATATEPAAWGHSVTDSSITAAGYFSFGYTGAAGTGYGASAGTRFRLFQLSFGTNGDLAPASMAKTLTGRVQKPDGTDASGYVVRCYSQSSGQLIGETLSTSTGLFTFPLSSTDPVYCVAVDQLGNTWKAQILDRLIPV